MNHPSAQTMADAFGVAPEQIIEQAISAWDYLGQPGPYGRAT